ncbi:MAG: DUF6049 family protein [Microthrixaceae bacterium]
MNGPSRARATRVRIAAALFVTAAVALAALGTSPTAGARARQDSPPTTTPTRAGAGAAAGSGPLTITEVSPWVAAQGTFEVRFAPTSLPAGSVLRYTVHQRLRDGRSGSIRGSLDALLDGASPGPVLRGPVEVPVDQLGDPAAGPVLRVPIDPSRGGTGRVYVPDPGIHPVSLDLLDTSGRELWADRVLLNRLPADAVEDPGGAPGRMAVTLLLPIEGPPSLEPDGTATIDPVTRSAVASATTLLTAVPEAPLTLGLRPNTLTGAVRSGSAADEAFVQALRSPALRAAVARRTDVAVDVGGLVEAGATDELGRQLLDGAATLTDVTGRGVQVTTWLLDDTLGPASLPVLSGLGTRRVLLPAERLRLPSGVSPEDARSRALGLQDGSGLTVTAEDPLLTLRLTDPRQDPGVRANQVATSLMAGWFTAADEGAGAFPGPSAVVVVPPATDPAALRALLPALAGDGPLTADPAAVPTEPARVGGRTATASLAPRVPADQDGPVAVARTGQRLIDAYRRMAGSAEPDLELWSDLNSEVLSTQMDAGRRARTQAAIASDIERHAARIELPPERRVVLTSRDATVPLRFRNGLAYPVQVIIRARAPRLEIQGGDTQLVTLRPGENRVDLDVTVRAPGTALLRLDVRSPDGVIVLGRSNLPVTSSSISGVGAALSVVSLLVLLGWWLLTVRRRRREDARDAGHHPCQAGPPAGPDDPADDGDDAPDDTRNDTRNDTDPAAEGSGSTAPAAGSVGPGG